MTKTEGIDRLARWKPTFSRSFTPEKVKEAWDLMSDLAPTMASHDAIAATWCLGVLQVGDVSISAVHNLVSTEKVVRELRLPSRQDCADALALESLADEQPTAKDRDTLRAIARRVSVAGFAL